MRSVKSEQYPVPEGCSLRRLDAGHTQSDDKLISDLRRHRPITSELNVFAFWKDGLDALPPWCLRNVLSWMRRVEPQGWTVRVLDDLGLDKSANDFSHFFQAPDETVNGQSKEVRASLSMLPPAVFNRKMEGEYAAQHISDLVRLPLLWTYGGIWMDVSIMLFRDLEDFWKPLSSPKTDFRVGGFAFQLRPDSQIITNSFIAARKHDEFIRTWCEEGCKVWNDATSCEGLHEHDAFQEIGAMVPAPATMEQTNATKKEWSDYMINLLLFERTRYLKAQINGREFDGPEYFRNHFLLLDTIGEMYLAQTLTDWDGRKQFELLSYPMDGEDEEVIEKAQQLVGKVVSQSTLMKLSHGVKFNVPPLAQRWDMPENERADMKPGTFAAYLRYASENYVQDRKLEAWKPKDCEKSISV